VVVRSGVEEREGSEVAVEGRDLRTEVPREAEGGPSGAILGVVKMLDYIQEARCPKHGIDDKNREET
jgi:hypothetical protein